jgi:hypothetical protein
MEMWFPGPWHPDNASRSDSGPAMPTIPIPAQLDVRELTLQMDAHIVRLAYELEAARATCQKCGAGMRPEVTIEVRPTRARSARLMTVITRCSSPEEHCHTAQVRESDGSLALGPLRRRRRFGRQPR